MNMSNATSKYERGMLVERSTLRQKAQIVTRFVTIQIIALVGWLIVQSLFSLSPLGRSLPFTVMIIVETIWWIATLVLMYMLFMNVYKSFVKSAIELEDANNRLRQMTNQMLLNLREQRLQEKN